VAILEKRAADEEAERRHLAQEAIIKARQKLTGKKNAQQMKLIEEEERKRKQEEDRKALAEEAKKQA